EVAGVKHSLHRRWRDAPYFHATYAACIVAGAAIVVAPGTPLALVTTAVQALGGVLLPSSLIFLLLLCNDLEVLRPLVNGRRLNMLASAIVAVVLVASGMLTVSTLVPGLSASRPLVAGVVAGATILGATAGARLSRRTSRDRSDETADRGSWTMTPI